LKHYETNLIHPYSLKPFQQHQEHDKTHHGLGDFNVTNKSNKLPSFIGIQCIGNPHNPFDIAIDWECLLGWSLADS